MWWQSLLSVGLSFGLGSVLTHAAHLRAGQVQGIARVTHIPVSAIQAGDDLLVAAADAEGQKLTAASRQPLAAVKLPPRGEAVLSTVINGLTAVAPRSGSAPVSRSVGVTAPVSDGSGSEQPVDRGADIGNAVGIPAPQSTAFDVSGAFVPGAPSGSEE